MNWGGLSYEHTLRLCDALASSPSFRLVFDIGNPVFNDDIRGEAPYHSQSSWDFYCNVKEFIAHIHVKDGRRDHGKMIFTFPGEGDADVRRILSDLLKSGYDGGISIEPHMVRVFHEKDNGQDKDKLAFDNFVEYGRRLENMAVEGTGKQVKDFANRHLPLLRRHLGDCGQKAVPPCSRSNTLQVSFPVEKAGRPVYIIGCQKQKREQIWIKSKYWRPLRCFL